MMKFVDDTPTYKELALQELTDQIDAACDSAAVILSSADIAALLRELASDWEEHN